MLYYAAPMEGITTYIYRQAHARWYGGVDKYFTPFIAGRKMTSRERRDILPENNTGLTLVPQILTNKADDFLDIAGQLASYGYDTVNLNLGCPSGTVTAKKRGAGFLSDPDALDAFLYEIYEKCPLKISIKTRLGVSGLTEWNRLLDIYAKYPVQELIIHTRLLQEFYTGQTHPEAYAEAMERLHPAGIPLCYNGDIRSEESLQKTVHTVLENLPAADTGRIPGSDEPQHPDAGSGAAFPERYDDLDRIMIGRGLLRNPALAKQLRQPRQPKLPDQGSIEKDRNPYETLRAFHDEILDGYRQIMSGDLPVLFKMKDLWTYMIFAFTESESVNTGFIDTYTATHSASALSDRRNIDRHLKKIRKADRLSEYKIAVDSLFREYGSSTAISPA